MSDVAKLTGAQQIEVLKNLSQQAAAFLLGVSARTLRDHPDAPRCEDGAYDARTLLSSGMLQRDAPEFSVDELEKSFTIAEAMNYEITPQMLRFLRGLKERHGDAGWSAVLGILIEYWSELVDPNEREPTDAEIREKLEAEIDERIQRAQAEIDERIQRAQHERLTRQFKVAVRCDYCKKLRQGREWVKARTPIGYAESGSICPSCSKRPSPKNLDQAIERLAEQAAPADVS